MTLDNETVKKINEFVYTQPRTILEIAQLIEKNWRTADRYAERISEEFGTISIRTFRGGSRGALKIAYWNNIEKISNTSFQERLFRCIESGKTKYEFSPFDIYQYVPEDRRDAYMEAQKDEATEVKQELIGPIMSAQRQVLIFSGNISWANLVQDNQKMTDVFESVCRSGVSVKILAKVDIAAMKNYEKLMQVNERLAREAIEVRHAEQPLRAFVVDDKFAQFKEVKEPGSKRGELSKKTYIFYKIFDPDWVHWTQKVFWSLFRTALPAEKRIRDLKQIAGLRMI